VAVEQSFPLWNSSDGFVGAQLSYIGNNFGIFTGGSQTPAPRQQYPAYAKTDLSAGINYNSWRINCYANNVTDRRGLVGGGIGFFPSNAFVYIQPRTIGFSVSRTF